MKLKSIIALLGSTAFIPLGAVSVQAQDRNLPDAEAVDRANAETNENIGLDIITVTANRREQTLQDAGVPISAIGGDELIQAGVSETSGLSRLVPALSVQPTGGSGLTFYLRGVGTQSGNSFAENAVAFNFNGVYLGRPTAPAGTFYDLERVEVVKGPQGTLYGRNATGGAINVIPKKPRLGEVSGELNAEYGNYDTFRTSGALNLPLGEIAALRVAGQIVDRNGYLSDGYDDEQGEAFRVSLLAKPSDGFSVTIVGDYFSQGGKGPGAVLVTPENDAYTAPPVADRIGYSDPRSQAAASAYAATLFAPPFCGGFGGFVTSGCVGLPQGDGFIDNEFYGISAEIEADLGFGTLTVIPAYRKTKTDYVSYLPGFLLDVTDNADQYSLEARLSSNDDQRLRYVVGAFYFKEDQSADNYFAQGDLATTRFNPQLATESAAVFGELTFDVTETVRLIAGGRYTDESKTQLTQLASGGVRPGPGGRDPDVINPPFGTPFTGTLDFSKFTWKLGLEADIGPENLLYATVATGFKSGGFYVAAPPVNTFGPEELTAYTIGLKNRFLDNTLQVNLEMFYWDYKDQQVTFVGGNLQQDGSFAPGGTTINAGQAEMYGAEMDLLFEPYHNGLFRANVQWLQGEYKQLLVPIFSNPGPQPPTGCDIVAVRPVNGGRSNFFDNDCSGRPTIASPEWSINLGYQHTFEIGELALVAGIGTSIESSSFVSVTYLPEERRDAFMMSDASLTLKGPDNAWSLTAYINNIENEEVIARAGNRPIINTRYATLRPPRTYGLRGTFRF